MDKIEDLEARIEKTEIRLHNIEQAFIEYIDQTESLLPPNWANDVLDIRYKLHEAIERLNREDKE